MKRVDQLFPCLSNIEYLYKPSLVITELVCSTLLTSIVSSLLFSVEARQSYNTSGHSASTSARDLICIWIRTVKHSHMSGLLRRHLSMGSDLCFHRHLQESYRYSENKPIHYRSFSFDGNLYLSVS